MTTAEPTLDFDPDALREKYRLERDKRVRTDGNNQYIEVVGEYAHYIEDPYVQPIVREPVTNDVDVAVVGGGHGGLLIGSRLRMAGVQSIRMIEKGGDFGGTWYWNRYPGAACDTEAYIYMPLLEETGYVPTEKYAKAPEIRAHCQRIAQHFDLYRDALFQTQIKDVRWDESKEKWLVTTDRNDRFYAKFIAMANGPLNRPKLPGVPGIESFKGHSFHTSRWDYDYTGGDGYGNLTGLADKRVAIIGTGATAIQAVPHVGASAKQLFVFQRTPSSVDVRANRPTDPNWAKSLGQGWQRHRMENFSTVLAGGQVEEDLVSDGWTEIITKLLRGRVAGNATDGFGGGGAPDAVELGRVLEMADFEKMNQIRDRAASIVKDPSTAEALKPYYRQFCKRPCFHDDYLATFNRPNVTLVDTEGRGVERITENGVVANGVEYPLDCLIFATGFEVGTAYARRNGYEVVGRGGLTLTEKWKDGMSSLHGLTTRGFPNLFLIQNGQSGFGVNFPHMIDVQVSHAAWIIRQSTERQARTLEPTAEAEAAWVKTIVDSAIMRQRFQEECTPGYYNNEGQPSPLAARNGPYGKGPIAFANLIAKWRDEDGLKDLELT